MIAWGGALGGWLRGADSLEATLSGEWWPGGELCREWHVIFYASAWYIVSHVTFYRPPNVRTGFSRAIERAS